MLFDYLKASFVEGVKKRHESPSLLTRETPFCGLTRGGPPLKPHCGTHTFPANNKVEHNMFFLLAPELCEAVIMHLPPRFIYHLMQTNKRFCKLCKSEAYWARVAMPMVWGCVWDDFTAPSYMVLLELSHTNPPCRAERSKRVAVAVAVQPTPRGSLQVKKGGGGTLEREEGTYHKPCIPHHLACHPALVACQPSASVPDHPMHRAPPSWHATPLEDATPCRCGVWAHAVVAPQ